MRYNYLRFMVNVQKKWFYIKGPELKVSLNGRHPSIKCHQILFKTCPFWSTFPTNYSTFNFGTIIKGTCSQEGAILGKSADFVLDILLSNLKKESEKIVHFKNNGKFIVIFYTNNQNSCLYLMLARLWRLSTLIK